MKKIIVGAILIALFLAFIYTYPHSLVFLTSVFVYLKGLIINSFSDCGGDLMCYPYSCADASQDMINLLKDKVEINQTSCLVNICKDGIKPNKQNETFKTEIRNGEKVNVVEINYWYEENGTVICPPSCFVGHGYNCYLFKGKKYYIDATTIHFPTQNRNVRFVCLD